MRRTFLFLSLLLVVLSSCNKRTPKQGTWRMVLQTVDSAEIPFNFNLNFDDKKAVIEILTGNEKYLVDDISIVDDSLLFNMPLFNASFKMAMTRDGMEGQFIRSTYDMKAFATPNESRRFLEQISPDSHLIEGRWRISLGSRANLIGEFVEENGIITGSFLTVAGDLRFFEGILDTSNTLRLSCFDGGFVRLFEAKLTDKDSLSDIRFYSGYNVVELGTGFRDSEMQLPNPYNVTKMKSGFTKLGFNFPNLKKVPVSLSESRFNNKVVIVQISGSWCPNCLDESKLLVDLRKRYANSLEVVGLAFERVEEYSAAREEVLKLVNVAKIDYDFLVTGYTPSRLKEALPELENFRAFPTTIFIDKKGVVRNIHSGFSGPGTGIHYTKLIDEFVSIIEELIAENE